MAAALALPADAMARGHDGGGGHGGGGHGGGAQGAGHGGGRGGGGHRGMAAVAEAIGLVATVTVDIGTAVAGGAATVLGPAGRGPMLDGSGFATR